MKRLLIGLGLAAALTVFLTWWFSDAQVLKRRVGSMIETAEVPPLMSDAGRKARGGHLIQYLAKQVGFEEPEDFDLPASSPIDRQTAGALYSGAATYAKEITFTDFEVLAVEIDGDEASVKFRADTIVDLRSRRPVDGVLTVDSSWRKTDGTWLLRHFTWEESPR